MKNRISSFTIITIAILFASCLKEDTPIGTELTAVDRNFILQQSMHDSAEIRAANLAISKSTDSLILDYANFMLKENKSLKFDLKQMGTLVGFEVKDTIDAASIAEIASFDTLTGSLFDSAYVHSRVARKQPTIDFYNVEIDNGSQRNVKAYATNNLNRIKFHYERADTLAKYY